MKTQKALFIAGVVLSVLSAGAMAATATVFDLGTRYHQQNSAFTGLPYADGDMTYCAAYEIHEQSSLLQFVCGYTPDFKKRPDLDYGLTPDLNLLAKDGLFQGGAGILSTYTRDSDGKGDWMDLYWQLILGLNIPLGKSWSLQANAYYVFKSWDRLGDFKFEDIEFGGYLGYSF